MTYRADEFDWTAQESAFSELPRFHLELSGLGVHFINARAQNAPGDALPLVLCHGWPD
ncbi:epoxide hydrolase N-terminal domain-containing protein [Mycolicibacterium sp. YH-1]|uniref:epoxide hydrolase N-terminal domain-containing protein n=1 Tax=Mycolicibacterium sp. YH-1 TaxID=2908837 RepID=UPI001F4C49F8|nr:epoxide hydrolase N-terminal domain-containing protein [Mycolicibacterium sp. YH-1]UNB52932.1 epoxide hydrolase N-terminal domain-containing protein [Mycolicibacterium sp. YH-1]